MATLHTQICEMSLGESYSHNNGEEMNENEATGKQIDTSLTTWRTPPALNEELERLPDSQDSDYRTDEELAEYGERTRPGNEPEYGEDNESENEASYGRNVSGQRNEDCIRIHNNQGVVIVDLGEEKEDTTMTEVDSGIKGCWMPTKRLLQSSAKRSLSMDEYDNERSGVKKFPRRSCYKSSKYVAANFRQTKIAFPRCKSKMNTKKAVRKASNDSNKGIERHFYSEGKNININIQNNSGTVVIGDGVTYDSGCVTGENVMADGSCPNMVMAPQYGPVVRANKSTFRRLDKFYKVIEGIYPLQENGRWDDFYQDVESRLAFARNRGQIDEEIFLTIEKGIGLSYQKKNKESLKLIHSANDMIRREGKLPMQEFLLVLSHCQLAALYRRENKTWEADKAVFLAEQNAQFVPCNLTKAYVNYEKASNQTLSLSIVSTSEPERVGRAASAKEALKECISMCERMLEENEGVYLRKHIFSLLKLALMNLNCRTPTARSQQVDEEDIREAEDCIRRMQERYSGHLNEAISVQLNTALCDMSYRRGRYTEAMKHAGVALQVCQSIGFQIEIKALEERLDELNLLRQGQATITEIPCDPNVPMKEYD